MPAYTPQLRHNFGDNIAYNPPSLTKSHHAADQHNQKIATNHLPPVKVHNKSSHTSLIAMSDLAESKLSNLNKASKANTAKTKANTVINSPVANKPNETVSVISWRKNHDKEKIAMSPTHKSKEVEMVIMQPLPALSADSREPFKNSGITVAAPF